jgi:hypothetical protein
MKLPRIDLNLFHSPGRKAGDRKANRAVRRPIPGRAAWASKDLITGEVWSRPTAARWAFVVIAALALLIPSTPVNSADKPAAVSDEPIVDPQTAETIDGALRYLAAHQQPTGCWGEGRNKVAYTGYTLMAFMAGGSLPDEGPYGDVVAKGTKYLLECVRGDGYIIAADETMNDKGMYGHGIATIALGELYGQTHDTRIRPKLERAVKLICDTQNAQGGWRYFPRIADADLSVTVLQVVALRAAINDGIAVPQETVDKAVKYVKSCRAMGGGGGFAYQPGGQAGFARTAAAIYSLQVCGKYDDPMVAAGSKYLLSGQGREREWFTYGNFYAAPAQYMVGGATWKTWYEGIRTTLAQRVKRQGDQCYWPRVDGDGSGGDEGYVTAVNAMILAMPYHYIPLYQR